MVWCCVPGGERRSLPLALLPPTSTCSSPCHIRFCLVVVIFAGLFLPSAQTFAPMTDSERPRYRTAYACEGSTLNMECDPGHVINLIRANYGRFSITICNEHGNTEWSVNCMSPRSHRVLHDKCSQRQNCSVAASTRGFGDPCPGTLKYLEAHFQCVDVNPPSHTARPRPPWFIATKTTVSSITEDDPPLPSPPTKGGSGVPVGGSGGGGGGIGGPFGVGEGSRLGGDGIGDSGENASGGGEGATGVGGGVGGLSGKEGLPFENRLKEPPADDLPHSVTASSSTTTTLRPPPWLITNTTKNTTLSTTTTSTTSTTTTTAKPPSTTTTTTSKPQTNLDSPVDSPSAEESGAGGLSNQGNGEGATDEDDDEDDDASPTELYDAVESDRFPSSPVSTTTPWPVRAEVPVTEGASLGNEASWCPPSSDRSLVWNWTQGGEVAVQPCPGGASGWARRSCNPLGWSGPADLSECRSVWLTTLTSRAHASDAVLAVAHDLAIVTGSRALYGGDVTATASLINSLAQRMAEDVSNFPDRAQREAMVTELVGAVVATGSHLVGRQRAAWGDLRPPEHQAAATALLLGLEEAAFLLADNLHQEKTVIHAESNILLRLQVLETRNVVAVSFPSPGEAWLPSAPTRPSDPSSSPTAPLATTSSYLDTVPSAPMSDFPQDVVGGGGATPKVPLDTITLPPEAMLENADNGLVKIVFFSFDGLHHMLQPNGGIYHFNFKGVNRTRVLNSRVLSASLGAGRHIELSEPVVLTFAMIRTVNVTNPACVFWDYTTSSWSEEGCRVLRYNTSHTVCECEHLTNFAVLMDVHATPVPYPHQLALSIITYVGCIISIVCLLLATIVFHAFRGLKSDRTTIHKNLCVCLLVAETVFLAGVNQTDKPEVCGVVAGLLHFFLLAAFCWMFMEGFQLYVMLVEVFESEKPRARWYYAASYGFPAIVVAVSAVVDPFGYGTKDACWLKTDNYFIFAFVGPVIAIIIANCIFLGMAMFIMCRTANISASLKNKEHTKLASVNGNEENALHDKFQKHVIWVRGAVMLIVLLGLTWTFGLLYLNQATVVMAYIFTVLNSLQGLFIFIFHCVQNEKVKKELRRAGRRHPWLRACLCAAHDRSHTTTKDARTTSHNAASHSHSNSHASHTTLVPHLTSGRWTRGGSKGSNTSSSQAGTMSQPQPPPTTTPVRGGSLSRASMSRGSLSRTPQRNSSGRSARHLHHTLHTRTVTAHDHDDEYSFKSSGRDSGHGGSEQEDSPRTGSAAKLAALHLNNSVAPHLTPDHLVNPFTANNGAVAAASVVHEQGTPGPEALLPDYRLAEGTPTLRVPAGNSVIGRGHRTHSPWNHTYTEIPDGTQAGRQSNMEGGTDPVYEEIEREVRSDLQMSDLSDEDGRRHSSDISRQSSRSYGDHRPLLPYTLSEHHHSTVPHHHQLTHYDPRFKARVRHQDNIEDQHSRTLPGSRIGIGPQLDHTVVSPGHILPMTHAAVTSAHALPHGNGHIASQQYIDNGSHSANSMHHMLDGGRQIVEYNQAMLAALGGGHTLPVVHPLSEPNLRNWEAAQRHRDLQQLQQLGEMTVAVLSGEQVVCKLKPPLAPIHENSAGVQAERHPPPPTYSHC
ncbi:latrophilin Cirl-like isoform X4 [Macrobrachium nipponense]|uniref:latrophilin Cirl-like isoform X4 n=1 Tax=Macrobrachium nipponense TaxID=159736 RepID=UPI0030C7D5C1